jgi:valyl-tRNA synthetase
MIFINKLWNASRFVHTNLTNINKQLQLKDSDIDIIENKLISFYDKLMFHEKWILSRLKYVSDLVTSSMEIYNFSEAGQELQTFTKHEFCDYYIEEFKITKNISKYSEDVIIFVINKLLKLWHPYIPFVTTEIADKL